jgi:PAS domain S-box-containing protein
MASGALSAADLRSAIARREVIPYFQPIVELRSGKLWGFEMLARWQHPDRGMVRPDQFISLAENSGLMDPLSESLNDQAFELLRSGFPRHLTLSINISPSQMHDRGLPARIQRAAERTAFLLQQLVIEITETALLEDMEVAIEVANDLKALEIRLSLDDFGTGYSSLRYLNSLPLDEIKIDQSFVSSMNEQRDSRKIAAAVAGLGQSLNLTTVGEGIEERAHADMLFYLGCELGQGYFYSRPIPADEVKAVIAKGRLASPPSSPLLATEMARQLEVVPALRLAQLQAIYDSVPEGLCFLDKDLRYVSVNKRFTELAPTALGPLLGRKVEEVHPLIFAQVGSYLRRALAGEPSHNVEVDSPRAAFPSDPGTVVMYCHPVRDEANEIVGVSVAIRDITAFKRIERELQEQKERYRIPLELNASYPFTADPEGNITWGDPRGAFGRSPEDLLRHGWQKVIHPDDLPAVLKQWQSDIKTGTPHEIEFRALSSDGNWRRMRSHVTPRRAENGEILGWYGLLDDIDDLERTAGAQSETVKPVDDITNTK